MKTLIFKTYSDFLKRSDKRINGVSQKIADECPDYEKQNRDNEGCWNCRDLVDCRGLIDCSNLVNCSGLVDCRGLIDCSNLVNCRVLIYCSGLIDCSNLVNCRGLVDCRNLVDCSDLVDCRVLVDCSDLVDCRGLVDCRDLVDFKNKKYYFNNYKYTGEVPKIKDIHQKVLAGCLVSNNFNMEMWHVKTDCGTTHCRAGMNVHLSGEAGEKIEKETSTLFASMLLYDVNSNIEVMNYQYFVSNKEGIEDMKRCAELEIKAGK